MIPARSPRGEASSGGFRQGSANFRKHAEGHRSNSAAGPGQFEVKNRGIAMMSALANLLIFGCFTKLSAISARPIITLFFNFSMRDYLTQVI
jgi:hypothetical protein